MRAALYARFSTENQSEASIDDQIRACERTAVSQGLDVVRRFSDRSISAGTTDRPGYQSLLTAARAGEFEVIVTEDLSRLWRSRAEFGARSAELEDLNVQLITCTGDDTRRDGYGLVLGIKSAMAEAYRKEVSYRTRRGMEGLAAAGKSTGGKCYGYAPGEADVVLLGGDQDEVFVVGVRHQHPRFDRRVGMVVGEASPLRDHDAGVGQGREEFLRIGDTRKG